MERVQSISEEDSMAEGIKELGNCSPPNYDHNAKQYSNGISVGHKTAKDAFKSLWWKINGRESWNKDP